MRIIPMVIIKVCECGMEIKGVSEKHAKSNLTIHKQSSKLHKMLMKNKGVKK